MWTWTEVSFLGWHHFLDRWHCLNGSTTTVIILNVSFNIENTFTLCSLRFHCAKLQFEVCCNHLIVWSYCGFIKSNCDDVNDENEGTDICDFLPLKFYHYPSLPVPVPELFCKYPTRPVPKSKTPTRQTLAMFSSPQLLYIHNIKPKLSAKQVFTVREWF